jgi:cytochrome bd-type quinol oxidase subunit 2
VYNLVDTLPVAILKEELPCANDCDDEFCHGDGWLCKAQEYLLLTVFIILLRILMELFMKTVLSFSARKTQTISSAYTKITAVITGILVVFCLLADSELLASGSSQYRQLIVARDSFSCAPRFSSAVQEHLLLTTPFMMVCLALITIVVAIVYNIWIMTKKTGTTTGNAMSKFGKVAGKLLLLACMVALLWLIRVCVTAVQQPLIEGFNVDSQAFADCTFQAAMTSTWQAANNGRVELCSPIPNTGDTMLASKVLMICVKNIQGWVVGVVWGISLLTFSSLRRGFKSTAKISSAVSSAASSGVPSVASSAVSSVASQ